MDPQKNKVPQSALKINHVFVIRTLAVDQHKGTFIHDMILHVILTNMTNVIEFPRQDITGDCRENVLYLLLRTLSNENGDGGR